MTIARSEQVDLDRTPLYHCISRCVRRAFLCGEDRHSGKCFDHRKEWIVERLRLLASVFAIDLCAYAVLANHFHLVVRVDRERAQGWSDDEVIERYGRLFQLSKAQLEALPDAVRSQRVALWRVRLADLSWMMRGLNEWIARRANREDECRGRFWEGRFKSQPILDEAGLITCMSYVDLNPVRAGLSRGLEDSDFTSIRERLQAAADAIAQSDESDEHAASTESEPTATASPTWLAPFRDQCRGDDPRIDAALPMLFGDYAALLDWTGRALRNGKRGRIRNAPPLALARLNIDAEAWLRTMSVHGLASFSRVGTSERLQAEAAHRGQSWCKGQRLARQLYREAA